MISTAPTCSQLPGPVPPQLLGPVNMAGPPYSNNMWQQAAALQGPVFLQQDTTTQLSSSLQGLQTNAEHPMALQQGDAGRIEISKLKAVLQDVLRSLADYEPASAVSNNPGDLAQLQGPCTVLPQHPAPAQQPQPLQQVYVSASGLQIALVGGTQPMVMHEDPGYPCTMENSSCTQVQHFGAGGCMGAAAGSQQMMVSTTVDQEPTITTVLMGIQQHLPPACPNTVSSSAYCMPANMACPSPSTNPCVVPLGSCDSVISPLQPNGMQQASFSSFAGSQHLVAPGTPQQTYGSCMRGSCQAQQHLPSRARPGPCAGSAAGYAGRAFSYAGSTGGGHAGNPGICANSTGGHVGNSGLCAGSTGGHAGNPGSRAGSTSGHAGNAGSRAGSTGGHAGNPGSRAGSTSGHAGNPGSRAGSTGGHAGNPGICAGSTGGYVGNTLSHTGTQAMLVRTAGRPIATVPAPGVVQEGSPANDRPVVDLPAPWDSISLDEGLQQLWNSDQLQEAVGGYMYNTAERTASEPDGKLSAQDLFDFQLLKYVIHKLDASQRPRVRLVVRMHAVADYGGCDLKLFYFGVRCVISDLCEEAGTRGLQGLRVLGLVRLALTLQEALRLGPK